MLQTMLKKWWLILLQGLLMIVLSIFIFNRPAAVLAGISLWFGILVLAVGISGILAWLVTPGAERSAGSFIWSLVTASFGLMMLMHLLATMKAVTILFGIWVLVTGYHILTSGWSRRQDGWMWWGLVLTGALSMVAGIWMIVNMGSGAVGLSTLLGIQVFLTGLALVVLALVKKKIVKRIEDRIDHLKARP